ncbi:hypothetical protein L195_g060565, partial [Trifolium pratense]
RSDIAVWNLSKKNLDGWRWFCKTVCRNVLEPVLTVSASVMKLHLYFLCDVQLFSRLKDNS